VLLSRCRSAEAIPLQAIGLRIGAGGGGRSPKVRGNVAGEAQRLHRSLRMATPVRSTWRTIRTELSALASLVLTTPSSWLLCEGSYDAAIPYPTPVVLVHGLLGSQANFLTLRTFLAARGLRNFSSFSYRPRIDHRGLALGLGHTLETVCAATGAKQVDVVGHSLGGLVARYLIEIGEGRRVRRLVTLGSPHYTKRIPEQELAIYAAHDPLVPAPHPIYGPHGHIRVVPDCGHLGLLYHPTVQRAVARYLMTDQVESAEGAWLRSRAAA
jgi:palmitoyl protein thioesterase